VFAVAALIAVPLPFRTPVMLVESVIAGVVVAFATVPANPLADTTETVVTVPDPPPPPVYCGILSVLPTNVAAPDVPVVVSVIGA
jgi:hypothetical protein